MKRVKKYRIVSKEHRNTASHNKVFVSENGCTIR